MALLTSIRHLRQFNGVIEMRSIQRTLFTQRITALSWTKLHPLPNRNFVSVTWKWKVTDNFTINGKLALGALAIALAVYIFPSKPKPVTDKWINWPNKPDKVFRGRKEDMNRLSNSFSRTDDEKNTTKVSALKGMGGIGKTQIALSFGEKYEEKYENLIFINCENTETFLNSLAILKKALARQDISTPAQARLKAVALNGQESTPEKPIQASIKESLELLRKHLLVIDNVDTYEIAKAVEQILSTQSKGDVILTGRHPHIFEISNAHLEIKKLNAEAGIEVFRELLKPIYREHFDKFNEADKGKFIEQDLGGIPLFIRAAAGYFSNYNRPENPLTLNDYRGKMRSLNVDFLEALLEGKPPEDQIAAKTAYRTYALHIPEIESRVNAKARAMVKDVLYFLGFYGMLQEVKLPSGAELGMLLECLRKCSSNKSAFYVSEEAFHHCLQSIFNELENRFLIKRDVKNGTLVIHQTTKLMIHYTFLSSEEIVKLEKETEEAIAKNKEWYQTSIFRGLTPTSPAASDDNERYKLEKKKMTWLLGAFEYAVASMGSAGPASVIGFIDYVENTDNGLSKRFRSEFVDNLNRKIPIVMDNMDLLMKIAEQLSIEDLRKWLATSKKFDKSGNAFYDVKQLNCILEMGARFKNLGISHDEQSAKSYFQKSEQLFLIAREAGVSLANLELGHLCYIESQKYKNESKLEEARKYYSSYIENMNVVSEEKQKVRHMLGIENNESAALYYHRSFCYKENEYQKAISDLQNAIELDPFTLLYYKSLETIYLKHKIQDSDFFSLYKKIIHLKELPEYKSINDKDNGYKETLLKFFKSKESFPHYEGNSYHSMKDRGVLFGKIINQNPDVKKIKLNGCHLDDNGVKAIAESLKKNTSIETLALEWNRDISDAGIDALADALKKNKHVKEISLHKNVNITPDSVRRLILSVDHGQLKTITLTECPQLEAKEVELRALAKTKRIYLEF